MARRERWLAELPRRPPAEYACLIARDRFWRDEHRRVLELHPDLDEGAAGALLDLDPLLGHALVLVLSRLPVEARRDFAERFYRERRSGARPRGLRLEPGQRLALAASVALLVLDVGNEDAVFGERVVDLVHGAAQGDDPSLTPEAALAEVRKAVARVRLDVDYDDPGSPQGAAALAVAEVLDPSSETVDLQEVVARAAVATAEHRTAPDALAFLLEVDRLFARL